MVANSTPFCALVQSPDQGTPHSPKLSYRKPIAVVHSYLRNPAERSLQGSIIRYPYP